MNLINTVALILGKANIYEWSTFENEIRDTRSKIQSIDYIRETVVCRAGNKREKEKRRKKKGRRPPSHPDTLHSCQSYVNPRCFFAALLIIDHLITIHYTPLFLLWYTVREGIIRAPRETE